MKQYFEKTYSSAQNYYDLIFALESAQEDALELKRSIAKIDNIAENADAFMRMQHELEEAEATVSYCEMQLANAEEESA